MNLRLAITPLPNVTCPNCGRQFGVDKCSLCATLESENAALREQLAQAQDELTELRKFKQDMLGEFLGI